MCRYEYHYYPKCGHIANYTVVSCLEFTNHLRFQTANVGDSPCEPRHSSCNDIKASHDLLPPDHPDLCLQCAYDWNLPQDHDAQSPKNNRALEGLNAADPIIDFKARMVVPKRSRVTNTIHETRTDIYQSHPSGYHTEYTCSASFSSVGSPMNLEFPRCVPFDSSRTLEFDTSCDLDYDSDEATDPYSQLDLGHESHGLYPSTGTCFDVCATDGLSSAFYDFEHLSYVSSVDSSDIDMNDDLEPMPEIVTECLAQLDLGCVEKDMTHNGIDLLAALPSPKHIIIELIQACRTGIISNHITPEILPLDDGSNDNQTLRKPTPTLNHYDSKTSLWHANMSSVSSPDFRNYADKWFSDLELASFGIKTSLDSTVEYGATAEFLDLSDDEEGGC
ncbi:hypothetical protein N7507_008061 [Penicillium longicatenatum]|nr:hypothetical protein N7507_008061 [Penicillium longicatenatum]